MPGTGIDKNRRSAFSTPRQATKKGLTSARPFIYKKCSKIMIPKQNAWAHSSTYHKSRDSLGRVDGYDGYPHKPDVLKGSGREVVEMDYDYAWSRLSDTISNSYCFLV